MKKLLLITIILLLLTAFSYYCLNFEITDIKSFKISKNEKQEVVKVETEKVYSNCIVIPSVKVQAPLVFNTDRKLNQNDLKKGVIHYANTAMFGQTGNCFLIGHSSKPPENAKGKYDTVFAPLVNLNLDDKIIIYYDKKYTYKVFQILIVEETQMEVLKPTAEPTLTLMTCYPVGTSKQRLIVKSKLVK